MLLLSTIASRILQNICSVKKRYEARLNMTSSEVKLKLHVWSKMGNRKHCVGAKTQWSDRKLERCVFLTLCLLANVTVHNVWYTAQGKDFSVGHFTWGRLALSNQEGTLCIPGSEEESHGFVSRNVLEEPPAAQAHIRVHASSLTTSPSLRDTACALSDVVWVACCWDQYHYVSCVRTYDSVSTVVIAIKLCGM